MPGIKHQIYQCADAGSVVCPCFLAESGHCVQCSLLQGEELCHCLWSGVCVYNEFAWRREEPRPPREEISAEIRGKEYLSPDTVQLTLLVPEDFWRECRNAGSYVLVRANERPAMFDTPMVVSDTGTKEPSIVLIAQALGPKTKALEAANALVRLKGPFPNGLLGYRYLERLTGARALLVARGVCQGAALPVARQLIAQGNTATAMVDPGQTGRVFVAGPFGDLGIPIREGSLLDDEGKELLHRILSTEKIDLIFSGGSDLQHLHIREVVRAIDLRIPMVVTNNQTVCCGEGICGGCQVTTVDGQSVRTCKTVLKMEDLWV
jgi:hypothetical protein